VLSKNHKVEDTSVKLQGKFILIFNLLSFLCSVALQNVPYSHLHPKKLDLCSHRRNADLPAVPYTGGSAPHTPL